MDETTQLAATEFGFTTDTPMLGREGTFDMAQVGAEPRDIRVRVIGSQRDWSGRRVLRVETIADPMGTEGSTQCATMNEIEWFAVAS